MEGSKRIFDGPSRLPQLPDYFGFVLGFLLIWLIYTGYGAVEKVFVQTKQSAVTLSERAKLATQDSVLAMQNQAKDFAASESSFVEKAKDKVDELQLKLGRARLTSEPAPVVKEVAHKKNWSRDQLNKANSFINDVISTIGQAIYGESEEEQVPEKSTSLPKEAAVNRSDSLEWFH